MQKKTLFEIHPVRSAADLLATSELFQAYASSLDVDLSYQSFATEVQTLPGMYAPPKGELLLGRDPAGSAVGCVGLRPTPPQGCCEMKRLYVSPEGRGLGLGKALVEAIVNVAEQKGYREIRLDTLPSMTEALRLYEKAGFGRIAPYYKTPVAGTTFLAKVLSRASAGRREGPERDAG